MKAVLRSYVPFLIWLALSLASLLPSPAAAAENREPLDVLLADARAHRANERWNDLARLPLPAAGSELWRERRDAECELLLLRGIAALHAGYPAMAWYALERLEKAGCDSMAPWPTTH